MIYIVASITFSQKTKIGTRNQCKLSVQLFKINKYTRVPTYVYSTHIVKL